MSDEPERISRRRYALMVLGLIAAGFVVTEWFVRDSVGEVATMKASQKFVLKILAVDKSDIAAGDSHVGSIDRHAPYAFLGLGGITPRELELALRTYFRSRPVGRVMVEIGPQQVAAKRQAEWRALAKYSLVRQVMPFNVYFFEPEFISIAEQRLAEAFPWRPAAKSTAKTSARGKTGRPARKASREKPVDKKHAPYNELPDEVRRQRIPNHATRQRPVENFEGSPAWQAQERIIRWLVARGGSICLIRTPVTREYEEWLTGPESEGVFTLHRQAVKALAEELHVRYVDYLDLGLADLPLEDFQNPDHMNDAGHRVYWPAVDKACFPSVESAVRTP